MHRLLALALILSLSSTASAEEWPQFRGPTGQGISSEKALPTRWSATENVAWKADVPGDAHSSPIVWGERVFVTTAADGGVSCRILAFNRADGKELWNVEVFRQEKTNKQPENSYATPTPATDGEHVYAVFNDGSIAALTVDGKSAWTNRDVKHYSQHGLGSSPILYKDLLIMPYDGSSRGPNKGVGWQTPWEEAFLLAVDKQTGKERWRQRGPSRIAHTTPIIVKMDGKDELVSTAGDVIQGFDPLTGERHWSVRAEGEGVVPSPVSGEGVVFAASGFPLKTLRAVSLEEKEEPNSRKVLWESRKQVSTIPSAVYVKPYLFMVTENGTASCLDTTSGKAVWTERLEGNHSASPVAADGLIYFLSDAGAMTLVKAAPTFEIVARNTLGEPCRASPAFAHGHIFIRTARHLVCLGAP